MPNIFDQETSVTPNIAPELQPAFAWGAQNALDLAQMGPYAGPFYAGLNPIQRNAINAGTGFAQGAGQAGGNMMGAGANLMGGFGPAMGYATAATQGQTNPWLQNPGAYFGLAGQAANDPYLQGAINAALRDPTNQLLEQTLPGISSVSAATGNTNSSGAALERAHAMRNYQDRAADVSAAMRSGAWNTGLGIANQAAMGDQAAGQWGAGQLANMGFGGAGLVGQGYGLQAQGVQNQLGYGQLKQDDANAAIKAQQQQWYEPWNVQNALANYITPQLSSTTGQTTYADMNAMQPIFAGLMQVIAANQAGEKPWDLTKIFDWGSNSTPETPG